MVKATEVVYKYYEVEFALKRGNNDALAWFGLFLAGINKSPARISGGIIFYSYNLFVFSGRILTSE